MLQLANYVLVNNSTNINNRTTIFHFKLLNTKQTTTDGVGNPIPGFGQAQGICCD